MQITIPLGTLVDMPYRSLPRSLALIAVGGALLVLAPSSASASAPADVNDFEFSSWDAVYDVSLDDDGRARMHVTETRVAEFPEFDQNRGIVAGFPQAYGDASIGTTILSVSDEDGADVPYDTESDEGMLYVLTGDDDYVHGRTTYVIEYEMRDVVLAAEKTLVDEFYWNLLPLDSTQRVSSFHAEIRFDDALSSRLTGDRSCYTGYIGSTDPCVLIDRGDGTFSVSEYDLAAGQGVTVAIAIEPGTAVQPSARTPNAATDVAPYFLSGGAAAASIGAWIGVASMKRRHRRATGIVVAQYEVPASLPPLLAGKILPGARDAMAAQFVHLAVGGSIRIEDGPATGKKKPDPQLRCLDAPLQERMDQQVMDVVFADVQPGEVLPLGEADGDLIARVSNLNEFATKMALARRLTTKVRSRAAMTLQWVSLGLLAVVAALWAWAALTGRTAAEPVLFVGALTAILVGGSCLMSFTRHTVLTPEGALQLEHLRGVEEFIRVAVADRLRMLQSYTGAERRADGTVNVIHLYEKLLPYAILFGLEKQWGGVLEYAYGQGGQTPLWTTTDPGSIRTSIASFSAATQSASSASSSSGGSTGGGFSGGGGGGGFSGGR